MRIPGILNAWHAYRSSVIAQAIVKNSGLLLGLVAFDLLLKLPPAGRMLYVLPVFCLTRVAGVRLGVALSVVTTIIAAMLDRFSGLGEAWLLNAIIRFSA